MKDDKIEEKIELVKKYYPTRDSIWDFLTTIGSAFVNHCQKNMLIDRRVSEYIKGKTVDVDERLYLWAIFAMIEFAELKKQNRGFVEQFIKI